MTTQPAHPIAPEQEISKLDPREQHFRIPSHLAGLHLFLRYMPPSSNRGGAPRIVLYVHGGTFPSALSIAHRFDGRSWRDELCAAGFHSWGFDFHGFGEFSDPYPEMRESAERHAPLGSAENASRAVPRWSIASFFSVRSRSGRVVATRSICQAGG